MRRRLLYALTALLIVAGTVIAGTGTALAATPILGGGSGFAALQIDQWRANVSRQPYNLTINYQAQGSSFGRQQFKDGTFDFGASDIQYTQIEIPDLQSHRCRGKSLQACFVYVPITAGGLAFMYNVTDDAGNRISDLKLTREDACKIFTGQITKWSQLGSYNPRLKSINRDIRPVIRADGAGESYVFSEFCIAVAPGVWGGFISEQKGSDNAGNNSVEFNQGLPTSLWPQSSWGANPIPVSFADGTAGFVADPSGGADSITYVANGYAKVHGTPVASVQNGVGLFTQPTEDNVTTALHYATPVGNGTFKLAYSGPAPDAYFPSTYSYILAQTSGFDPGKGATLGLFLCYAISTGQPSAPQLGYARLSSDLVQIAINAIVQIPGAPSSGDCFQKGAPPPPAPPGCAGCNVFGSGGTSKKVNGGVGGNTKTSGSGGTNGTGGAGGSNCNSSATTPTTAKPATSATTAKKNSAPSATTTTLPPTTTTTVACSSAGGGGPGGDNGTAGGAASIDSELAKAAIQPHKGASTPTIWIIAAGIFFAWLITTLWSQRKARA
jgi:ABC-type phosphate transport system substrate-binding protein